MDVGQLLISVGVPIGAALISIGAALAKRSEAPPAAHRETLLPAAPAASSAPGVSQAEHEALRREVEQLRAQVTAGEKSASSFRAKVLVRLARIFERLKIREERDDEDGGDRGSEA